MNEFRKNFPPFFEKWFNDQLTTFVEQYAKRQLGDQEYERLSKEPPNSEFDSPLEVIARDVEAGAEFAIELFKININMDEVENQTATEQTL
jgi:hypothetical protein